MELNRTQFMQTAAMAGTMLASLKARAVENAELSARKNPDQLNIALIGAGAQGRILAESCLRIPNINFKAVCDIWEYSQKYTGNMIKKYGHEINVYEDYKELIANEKDQLDAVVVASPDWMHAEHANACMEAGLHVYSEKEMSNSLEKAATMVHTAKATGQLLQIGHQRRSNPRYIHAIETLIHQEKLLGTVTTAVAQWNRAKADDIGFPKKYEMSAEKLDKYGYNSMMEFRNWRWYKKYGGGPIVDLGSHQIDLFEWVWETNPKSVIASGGTDFYKHREWYDNVMCIYEYDTPDGVARAFYETQTTTGHRGFSEAFRGTEGTIEIAEVPARGNSALREAHAPEWDTLAQKGLLRQKATPIKKSTTKNVAVDVRVTAAAAAWPLPVDLTKPAHQPHLENFFNAIRYGTELNCPGEKGYETAVAVLAVNRAVASGQRIEFKPSDFHA
ncbi:Gfo/Idh/MocA family protein [Pontiella sulfatireligans]|uniref:4-carboxy-2-hydroxymuconate-6-semialdehyde dehydrogenase n=1 Tax=Pontiella sulfatireligans TaxID=2750658 RepID=A0A6C2UHE7_9BACT|nr:Gfo/Idh/MocA family oxidoreductase [Pontiella sulfatireligans]VGO18774.1 4-carboxy-2-hydroxymuconate-6-semialdehyde dehydrogenase [Pontiella sulfatireligans]